MRRRDLLGGLSLVPLAAPAVAQCVVATFPRINLADRCEGGDANPPSLDLTFMVPGSLDPRITFTRASTGTYFDSAGVMQIAAINVPRWDYAGGVLQGLLLEDQRTNLLLNSATLSTQSVTVTAQAYTLSFYGTGTIAKSGTATGALVGTGIGQRVSQTFTPTAGSLTLTVTGTVSNAQLEAGAFATSFIPTTGATATRSIDNCVISPANMAPWFVPPGGSWFIEFISIGAPATTGRRLIARQAATPALGPVLYTVGTVLAQLDSIAQLNTANTIAVGAVSKGATNWAVGSARNCLNGGAVATSASLTAGYGTLATSGVFFFVNGLGAADSASGYIRAVRYWPGILSDAQMQAITS